MNAFVGAVEQNQKYGTTFNGAKTLVSSLNPLVDLFFQAGNRNVDLSSLFDEAVSKDKKLAYRVLLWSRDVRGGAGERQTFRNILKHLERHYEQDLMLMLPYIPEIGRWDDLLVFNVDRIQKAAFTVIKAGLFDTSTSGLVAKWMPRKGVEAVKLRKFFDMSPKQYRKMLVEKTKVVEQQMCAKDWNNIVFDHVPSLAAARYQKAFGKHCGQSYVDYRNGLKDQIVNGEVVKATRKINVGAVYPYDVLKSLQTGDRQVAIAQWDSLPNYLGDNFILPLVDVSASMSSWGYYNQRSLKNSVKSNLTPMDIAISLGLYIANKQSGAFAGMFMTFHENPTIQKLTGDILNMYNEMRRASWGGSTDLEKAFKRIIDLARQNKVPANEMPKVLLIMSDMEFNVACRNSQLTLFENAREMFEEAGYSLPKVVFWNLNGRVGNSPVESHQSGTALVSGFSPAILKSVLKDDYDSYDPNNVVIDAVKSSRYDIPGLTV